MKSGWQKVIDSVCDGELTPEQGRKLLGSMGAGKDVVAELERMLALTAELEDLDTPSPPEGLPARVEGEIRRRSIPAGSGTPLKKVAWAVGWAMAGAALAATVTVPLVRQRGPAATRPEQRMERLVPCRVRQVSGSVQLKRGADLAMVEPGKLLRSSDLLVAGDDGLLEVDVDRDARLVVFRESKIRVDKQSGRVKQFSLQQGRVSVQVLDGRARVVRLVAKPGGVVAETGGGEFAMLALGDGRVAVAAFRKDAKIRAGTEMTLGAGRVVMFPAGGGSATEAEIPEKVQLEVTRPAGPLHPGTVTVEGRTSSHARLWIGGRPVATNTDGSFSVRLDVKKGYTIELEAEDVAGNRSAITLGPARPAGSARKPALRRVKTRSWRVTW